MKEKNYLIVLLLVSVSGYSNHLPKPSVLFNITEKILFQAQEFLFASTDKPAKPLKVKPAKVKAKLPLTVPVDVNTPPVKPEAAVDKPLKLKRDGMFITCEQ